MRLPRPSCHALRVILLGASHHALASPRAFCYAFRTRSYRVLSHNRDLLHLIRGPMLGLLSVPHPERRSIRASCNHVYASGTIFEEVLSPPPYRGHCLSGCDITSMGICLSRGCPSPCCCASVDPPVSYVYRGLRPPRLTVPAAVGSSPGSLAMRGSNALADVASPMSHLDDCLSRLLAPTQPLGRK